jgi:hypothetical protein
MMAHEPDPREDQPDDAVPDTDADRRTVIEQPTRDDVEGPFRPTKSSREKRKDPQREE